MSVKQDNEDGNFIAKTEDKEAENKKETAEERMNRIFKEIEILKIKERSLAYEVGGTEKDYKKIQEFHPLATYNYYERALTHIKNVKPDETFNVLFFCEDNDIGDVLITINKLIEKCIFAKKS